MSSIHIKEGEWRTPRRSWTVRSDNTAVLRKWFYLSAIINQLPHRLFSLGRMLPGSHSIKNRKGFSRMGSRQGKNEAMIRGKWLDLPRKLWYAWHRGPHFEKHPRAKYARQFPFYASILQNQLYQTGKHCSYYAEWNYHVLPWYHS